jgi:energy-coupling factor transporter ATP-binding protein EcfA2
MKLVSVDQRTRGLRPGVAVLDQASARLGDELGRRVLAASGVPFAAWSRSPHELSGGERARVGLALALAQPFDLLLLDEPDNDLDLAAVEALEAGLESKLADTGAAMVIATHDRRLARSVGTRVWTVSAGGLVGHGSVSSYLRGDHGVAAATFWQTGAADDPGPETLRKAGQTPATALAAQQRLLEDERDAILDQLSDPLALSERENDRLGQRLLEVEGHLMGVYEAALAPAAPRYRLVERGLTLFADARPLGGDGADEQDGPDERDTRGGAGQVNHLLLVVAADATEATTALTQHEPTVPWLDVRLVGGVGHLRVGALSGCCLLPTTVAALVGAGVRMAFTVMGARSVQVFSDDDLSSTVLTPVGDGWWRLSLRQFLVSEGWTRVAQPGEDPGNGATRRTSRRGRRKAVKS